MMLPNHLNVMPVREKKPLISWQRLIDTPQTMEEKAAILEHGAPHNIGIVTGPVSRIFVLDIDGPEGEKSIEGKHIPRTWTVKTPHGIHYYFRWTAELDNRVTTRAAILPGVDVRGYGGYVVWYGWQVPPNLAQLQAVPSWLLECLPLKEKGEVGAKPGVVGTLSAIKEGNRNQSFASLAGGLRAKGYSEEAIYNLLESKAKEVQFPLEELRLVCKSISRYTPNVQGANDQQGQSVESFLEHQEDVKWICKPFIAEQAIGIIGGLPESRKSWILVDLAIECARGGGLWLGKFPVEGKKVLLIDQERSKSEVQRRLKAVIVGKGLSAADLASTLFVRSGTSTKIDLQPSYDALRKEIAEIRPEIILVDSFATFHTKEESNRMEIQQVMERIKQIRNEFNCAVVVIHHSTKQSYQSHKDGGEPSYLDLAGNVAIPAAAELCLSVVKHDDESSFVHHTKCTQGTKMAPFLVRVRDAAADSSQIVVEAY